MGVFRNSRVKVLLSLDGTTLDQQEIQNRSGLSHVTVSAVVQELCREGLASRTKAGSRNICGLSDDGRRLLKAIRPFLE